MKNAVLTVRGVGDRLLNMIIPTVQAKAGNCYKTYYCTSRVAAYQTCCTVGAQERCSGWYSMHPSNCPR
ncbi:hypothetical protein ACFFMR_32520 [Micromonospora andamanensis]|uniref:Uncharacterized protein n=1 Tax=Micromonospora andamanensis TaxID=1287068 RepID=A0ABQ4I232_9ACTN|nr:hypothetical protein [Micromonospora andamanensis]GIJ11933.1 hypothetical protein Van01_51470 [Micromonospora andamanensis]